MKNFLLTLIFLLITVCSCRQRSQTIDQPQTKSAADTLSVVQTENIKEEELTPWKSPQVSDISASELSGKAIELRATPAVYPVSASRIYVTLYNRNLGQIIAQIFYYLEYYNGEQWERMHFPENLSFEGSGPLLDQGKQYQFTVNLFPDVNNYKTGRYRVGVSQLLRFDTYFTVDESYTVQMTEANHAGGAFEMTVPTIISNPQLQIDTLKVIIYNHTRDQELISEEGFILSRFNGGDYVFYKMDPYNGFRGKIYNLSPGQSMEFDIPVKSDQYLFDSSVEPHFGPGKYQVIKFSKVDLTGEFRLE